MTIERDKAWAQGQRFLQRGQADKAIAEFERVAQEDPADLRAPLKLGDLELQRGNLPAARHHFLRVANAYIQEGFWSKAMAVLRQIAHAAHEDLEVQQLLAELYEKQGLSVEASRQYLHVAKLYKKENLSPQAAEALERAGDFDASDADAAVEWANFAVELGETAKATQKLSRMAERLREDNQLELWAKVAERLLLLDPQLSGVACQLARYAMTAGRPAAALANLRVAFRAAPQDLDILQLLAEAFEALGEVDKALSVYAELAAQARRRGQARMLERLLGHIVRLNPAAHDAQNELSRISDGGAKGLQVRRGVRKAEHRSEDKPALAGDVAALLVEARIFRRYRLVSRAREYLARVLVAFPNHPEARELDSTYAAEEADAKQRRGVAQASPATGAAEAPLPLAAEVTAQSAVERWRQSEAATDAAQAKHQAEPMQVPVATLLLSANALAAERLKLAESQAEPAWAPQANDNQAPAQAADIGAAQQAASDAASALVFDFDTLGDAQGASVADADAGKSPGSVNVDALDALIAAAGPAAQQSQNETLAAPGGPDDQVARTLAHVGQQAQEPADERFIAALQLGATYQDMELFDEALHQYEQVKGHAPLAAEAWRLAAQCLVKRGEVDAGLHAFARGLATNPTDPSQQRALHRDFAQALQDAGRTQEAAEHFAFAEPNEG